MPYITQYNCNNILRNIDPKNIKRECLQNIYKNYLWMLSHKEQTWLASAKLLFENPDIFINSVYEKNTPKDTKQYIYEGYFPAYHESNDCEKLKSNYTNFEIPVEIKSRGDSEIEKFRIWFKENQKLYIEDQRRFLTRLELTFSLKNPPRKITGSNSGAIEITNINTSTLESEIDQLINQAELFYKQSDTHKNTIDINWNRSFYLAKNANKDSIIYIWHNSYKEKLKEKLMNYFRIKLNPELEFSGKLLETLNFKKCSHCCITIDLSTLAAI